MADHRDTQILDSWHVNATPWTAAIADGVVRSRVLVTNAAIVEAITAHAPRRLLDVGCGEGWLCRAAQARGIETLGVDAIPALVSAAEQLDPGGAYQVQTYEAIGDGALRASAFAQAIRSDQAGAVSMAVCNFSLIGDMPVERLLAALAELLAPGRGRLLIQTLHPFALIDAAPYESGWRSGNWNGFPETFSDPAPWYARTFAGWVGLLTRTGFQLEEVREPLHPDTGRPASLILSAVSPR